jgi:hypothetical protein
MKTWNLGNTTVRNPERIKAGLEVINDSFEGQVFDLDCQIKLYESLLKAEVISSDSKNVGENNKAASGRKWFGVCYKLGLVARTKRIRGIISITNAGKALLSDDYLDSDVFLRQLLKVQLPSPTESELDGAAVHPFYLVLSIGVKLEELGLNSMTREEIALYVQSATNDNQTDEIIESIKDYRSVRGGIKGSIGKRKYFLECLNKKLAELYGKATNQKRSTLDNYSDTTVRYSAITGIFTIGRQSLQIKEDQLNLARAIIAAGPQPILDEDDFWIYFHNPTLPALPTDNTNFLERDIEALANRLAQLSQATGAELTSREAISNANILQLKRRREDLEMELISQKEIQFYRQQNETSQVEDIKSLFVSIMARETIGGSDYRPAWAEWGVWRVFLSINTIANPVSSSRGFKINSELYPVHHAKGGAADLLFEYEGGTIIPAEITLSSNERQFNMEGEAVKFHVKSVLEANQSKEVIGVFTAPDVHVATAHEFYNAEFYSQKMNGVIKLNIVPLSFKQLLSLLPGQKNACNNGDELLVKLRNLIELKEKASDGAVWLQQIDTVLA